jgi:3-dehydroquinate synthase
VRFGPGLCARYGADYAARFPDRQPVVLTDRRVHRLHGEAFLQSFRAAGLKPKLLVIPGGERCKSLESFTRLLERLAEAECDRRAVLVNFGGGVVSDLGGFVASAYMRGISYVNVATTLLAQLDASVGGKVAVNTSRAKNLIGAFHHPEEVVGDPLLLATLSERDLRSGIAEGIKVAIIASPELFDTFEARRAEVLARDPALLTAVIGTAARIKMELVGRDPYEADLRRPLNFGHTIGHPVETELGYRGIRHGEAVAVGMGVATLMARRKGLIAPADGERILDLLAGYGLLWSREPLRPDSVIEHVKAVRLIRGKRLHFVLPRGVGEVLITDDVSHADLVRGFEDYARVVAERCP